MISDQLMNDLNAEIEKTLKAMAKAKTPEERLTYSKTVKNLCQAMGVFLQAAADYMEYSDAFDGDLDEPF